VSRGLLTDHKVFVLGVAEKEMSAALQAQFTRDSELQIDDAAKIVGCWNGLAKRKILRPQIGAADIDDARCAGSWPSPGRSPTRRSSRRSSPTS
jgi:predicted helicase